MYFQQDKERSKNTSKSFLSKKSQDYAAKVVRRRILAIVEGLSQNGYISFPNFCKVLFELKINEICGNSNMEKHLHRINELDEDKLTEKGNYKQLIFQILIQLGLK